jgi:hypothetical protein
MKTALLAVAALAVAVARSSAATPEEAAVAGEDFGAAAAPLFEPAAYLRLRSLRDPNAPEMILPQAAPAPSATLRLAPLLDNARRTGETFRAGTRVVHVFGDVSDDKNDWFVGFAPEGEEAQYRNVKKMLKVGIFGGSAHVTIDGRAYTARVDANVMHRMRSTLVVTADDGSMPAASWTAKQISEALYQAGYPLTLDGREYRLLYMRSFVEDGSGNFGRFNGRRSVVLMFRDGEDFSGYHWYEDQIPSDAVLFTTPPATGSDHAVASSARIGLRLQSDGVLGVYLPVGR